MPFNFSSPEFLSHSKMRKNQVSPVSRARPAHMNSPLAGFSSLTGSEQLLTGADEFLTVDT